MNPHLAGASRLNLVCRKCTRVATFPAPNMEAAVNDAVRAGWHMAPASWSHPEYFTCPKCNGTSEPRRKMIVDGHGDVHNLLRGGAVVAREAHSLEVAGSTPVPASSSVRGIATNG